MAVFQISLSNAFYGFSGFGKEVTPCSRAKTVIPRDLLYSLRLLPRLFLEEYMASIVSNLSIKPKPSLFSSLYLGRNGCQADYAKLKITSKQKTTSQEF